MLRRAQSPRLLASESGRGSTRLLVLGRRDVTVGRAANNGLTLAAPDTTDRHASIVYARGRYYLVDSQSEAGTFLNGRRVRRSGALKHGDQIAFGKDSRFRFIDPDAALRRRNRLTWNAIAGIIVLVAAAWLAHAAKWHAEMQASPNESASRETAIPRAAIPAIAPPAPKAIATLATGPVPIRGLAAAAAPKEAMPKAAPSKVSLAEASHVAASPAASGSPAAAPSSAASFEWLARINHYRELCGIGALKNDPKLGEAVAAHAHYLLVNFGDRIRAGDPLGVASFGEDRHRDGYSKAGATVAQNSQVAWGCSPYNAEHQIDNWIAGPFHRLAILNPAIDDAAFGEAKSDDCWVAALRMPPVPELVKPYAHAIEFPPDGATVALDWIGVEAPDPLTACAGYERPVGLPITLQLGRLVDARLTAHSMTEDGKPVEHCAFDARSYTNQDPSAQEYARWAMRSSGAVVIVPRAPLDPGALYSVSISAANSTYTWSFRIEQ